LYEDLGIVQKLIDVLAAVPGYKLTSLFNGDVGSLCQFLDHLTMVFGIVLCRVALSVVA